MKRLFIAFAVSTSLIVSSCGMFDKENITDAKDIEKYEKDAMAKLSADKKYYTVRLEAKDHLSNEPGYLQVNLIDNSQLSKQEYNGKEWSAVTPISSIASSENQLKVNSGGLTKAGFDLKKIPGYYAEAVKLVPEEYTAKSLYSFQYNVSSDNKLTATMRLNVTKKGEGTRRSGKTITTTYYEMDFVIDEAGKVTLKEE